MLGKARRLVRRTRGCAHLARQPDSGRVPPAAVRWRHVAGSAPVDGRVRGAPEPAGAGGI